MYAPQYTITNEILKNIGIIEAAKEAIAAAPLVPNYERKFQNEAMVRTVYHGTHIEGNDLTLTQAQRVLEGEAITARERDIQEIINYRNVIKFLDSVDKPVSYNIKLLTHLHRLTTDKLLPEEQIGKLRTTQVVIKDAATDEVTFRPPPSVEVLFLLGDFFSWLGSGEGMEIHSVLRAAIAHYVLVGVHPFVEGNGRVSRAFATLVLFSEGYDIKKLFSLEEYFDKDAASYYRVLQNVSSQSEDLSQRDLTPFLEYFTKGLAIELVRIKEKVKRLSLDMRIKETLGGQLELSERQMILMEYMSEHAYLKRDMAKKLIPMVSEDTLLREFQDLLKKGIIEKEGRERGRSVKYKLRTH